MFLTLLADASRSTDTAAASGIGIAGLLMFAFLILLYFLPTVVAFLRSHYNAVPVLIVNLFFGWTGIGWIVALAWCFTSAPSGQHHHYHEPLPRRSRRRREFDDE